MIITAPAGLWLVTVNRDSDSTVIDAAVVLALDVDDGTPGLLTVDGWHRGPDVLPRNLVAAQICAAARDAAVDDREFVLTGTAELLVERAELVRIRDQAPTRRAEREAESIANVASLLDRAAVPLDATREQARDVLARVEGRRPRSELITAALRSRRDRTAS